MQTVGVLCGGRSAEHEVSVVSAQGVQSAIDRTRFRTMLFAVSRDGVWLTPRESGEALASIAAGSYRPLPPAPAGTPLLRPEVLEQLAGIDVAFPLIHGTHGEDGTLQGLLETLGVPYVGSGVTASAIGMDKAFMKQVFRQSGLPTSEWLVIRQGGWQRNKERGAAQVDSAIGYPCFVKPANMGSSVGVSKVKTPDELPVAIEMALRYDRKALVERAVSGRELEVAVLGNDEPVASPAGEIIPQGEFYDYAAKYLEDSARLLAPVELPAALEGQLQEMALAAFQSLDCAGMARVDFFLDGGEIYVNEVNTIPGFTPISMYPKLWQAAGLSYQDLITKLLELALERHEKKRRCA